MPTLLNNKKTNQFTTITDNGPAVKTERILLSLQIAKCFGLKNPSRA